MNTTVRSLAAVHLLVLLAARAVGPVRARASHLDGDDGLAAPHHRRCPRVPTLHCKNGSDRRPGVASFGRTHARLAPRTPDGGCCCDYYPPGFVGHGREIEATDCREPRRANDDDDDSEAVSSGGAHARCRGSSRPGADGAACDFSDAGVGEMCEHYATSLCANNEMNSCWRWQDQCPCWGPCVLSALAGSVLTLLVLRCKSSSHGPNTNKLATENGGAETICREGEKTRSYEGGGNVGEIVTIHEEVEGIPDRTHGQMRRTKSARPRTSFSGSFNWVDGERRHSFNEERYATVATNVVVLSEQGYFADNKSVMQAREFDEQVVSKLTTLDECKLLLHRTRVVSALASLLMAAPDEESCYDAVTRMLVPLFRVDRCSYALMKDAEHFVIKGVAVNIRKHATKLGLDGKNNGGLVKPLKGTLVGVCAETLRQQYCPRTKDSHMPHPRMMHSVGINSVVATPILVSGSKFAGCIIVSSVDEDSFKNYDRILLQDIASMLGAHIYSKRMKKSAEESSKISREMLHSLIPAKVIAKIEPFWDENSVEYQNRKTSQESITVDSTDHEDDLGETRGSLGGEPPQRPIVRCKSVNDKINFLQQMNAKDGSDLSASFIVDTSLMEIAPSLDIGRALYAENVKDVVIIFTDIVGFSKMSLCMKPLEVMDMLQSLFSRFDALCDKHGVQKLETIGDAYICTTNLFDEDQYNGNVKEAALSALNMAKDMVLATQDVILPGRLSPKGNSLFSKLEIRVGMHVGEVTCGVLGERLPKFTVFGHNVNLAARMEQTCTPSKIRLSEALYNLVANEVDDDFDECEVVQMKNMGDCKTYILDPNSHHNMF